MNLLSINTNAQILHLSNSYCNFILLYVSYFKLFFFRALSRDRLETYPYVNKQIYLMHLLDSIHKKDKLSVCRNQASPFIFALKYSTNFISKITSSNYSAQPQFKYIQAKENKQSSRELQGVQNHLRFHSMTSLIFSELLSLDAELFGSDSADPNPAQSSCSGQCTREISALCDRDPSLVGIRRWTLRMNHICAYLPLRPCCAFIQ